MVFQTYGIPEVDKQRTTIIVQRTTPGGANTGTIIIVGLVCVKIS